MFRKNSLPIGTIVMVLVIALALLSVGYALWSETLTIQGTVSTGEVDVEFSQHPVEECVDVAGVGDCLPEVTDDWDKSAAADCMVEWLGSEGEDPDLDNGANLLQVTVTGMYPSYHCKVAFDVTSTGNVPVHVWQPEPTGVIPGWVATDFDCYEDGIQLHQGDTTGICTIDIHFTNENAPPENSGPITFGWTILATQWNEEPPPMVVPGVPTWTKAAGLRVKGYNTGGEIYLGPMTSGSATPRVETNYNDFQTVGVKTYEITFAHDAGENNITATITSPDGSLLFDFDDSGAPGCPVNDWDAMEIYVRDSRTDSGLALENVMLDAYALGNFGTVDKAGTPGGQNWTVSGFDFSQSFVVTADLLVDGYNGNESIKTEFNVGCLP